MGVSPFYRAGSNFLLAPLKNTNELLSSQQFPMFQKLLSLSGRMGLLFAFDRVKYRAVSSNHSLTRRRIYVFQIIRVTVGLPGCIIAHGGRRRSTARRSRSGT